MSTKLTAGCLGNLKSRYFIIKSIKLNLALFCTSWNWFTFRLYYRPDPWPKKNKKKMGALNDSLVFTDERDRHKTR